MRVHVHEFMSLDGGIDASVWTFDYGFDPKMGEAIGAVTERCRASCSGARPTKCSSRRGRRAPSRTIRRAPFFNDATKYVISATLTTATWRKLEDHRAVRPGAIRSLKDEVDGDLYTGGSGTLARISAQEDRRHL